MRGTDAPAPEDPELEPRVSSPPPRLRSPGETAVRGAMAAREDYWFSVWAEVFDVLQRRP